MKICLATLHATPAFTPLALLYLKAYVVERGGHAFEDVAILEFTQVVLHEDMVQQVLATTPDVVGLSCYVWNIRKLMAGARRIKELRPGVTIVLGGPEVGPVATSVLDANPDVDVIVKSEGEIPFTEVLAALRDGRPLEQVKGICFRRGDAVIENEDAPLLQDLNQLASPHVARYGLHKGRIICIETQRGCVFRCNFCFYNKDLSVRNRRFDLERVTQEILFWLQQDINEIYLMDPVFNLNGARTKEICRFIVQHNHRRIAIHSEVWAEFIDEEMARLMFEAGFTFLEVGLQTTDRTALATTERRLRVNPFVDGLGHLKRYGLKFELQLIYGLPGDTLASFRNTLNFAHSLEPTYLEVYPLMILPGTELWRKAGPLDVQFDPEPPYFLRSHLTMSADDVEYGAKIIGAIEHLANTNTVRLLTKESNVTFSDIVDAWIAWRDEQPGEDAAGNIVERFIEHFCDKRQIPFEFYRAFSSIEFRDPRARSLDHPVTGNVR